MGRGYPRKSQVFKNPLLEAFTKTTPVITFITYCIIVSVFLFLSYREGVLDTGATFFTYVGGLAFWTFFEYIIHRYIFRFTSGSRVAKEVTGIHYENPRDHERLFMPPVPGIIIIGVVALIMRLIMGSFAFAFLAGWLNGYIIYAYIHHKVHNHKPPRILKKMWMHHNMHHYKYPDKAFGVSSPLWDIIFGTMPPNSNDSRNDKNDKDAPMYIVHSKVEHKKKYK